MEYFKTAIYSEAEAVADTHNTGYSYDDGVTTQRVDIVLHGGFYFVAMPEPIEGIDTVSYSVMAASFEQPEVL